MKLFENTSVAFTNKSDSELERAYFLFKLIASEPLVKIGTVVTKFALKSHLPIERLIRASVFDHFCGGVNIEESSKVVDKLKKKGVYSALDYSVEGAETEKSFDNCMKKIIEIIEKSKEEEALPFIVFKPTGYGKMSLYEKVSQNEELTTEEQEAWKRIEKRYEMTCLKAKEEGVKVLIDAEESWIQNAVDKLVEDMMERFNQEEAVIFCTVQLYLKNRLDYLLELEEKARSKGFVAGVKLVRGAYLEKEEERAKLLGYENPLCPSKEATDVNFDKGVLFTLNNISNMALFIGSHNEKSVYYTIELMKEKGIEKKNPNVWFGQLYGMSDHISYNLADKGYQVVKYLPFGPVKDVMPYLIRRAEENTSVAGQTARELELIKKEIKRRKLG